MLWARRVRRLSSKGSCTIGPQLQVAKREEKSLLEAAVPQSGLFQLNLSRNHIGILPHLRGNIKETRLQVTAAETSFCEQVQHPSCDLLKRRSVHGATNSCVLTKLGPNAFSPIPSE